MSRFARMYPDDYEERWERMIDAADFARKREREDAALASIAPLGDHPARPTTAEPADHTESTELGKERK